MSKFKVGQFIKVIDNGDNYGNYDEKAKELKATNWKGHFSSEYYNLKCKIIAIDISGHMLIELMEGSAKGSQYLFGNRPDYGSCVPYNSNNKKSKEEKQMPKFKIGDKVKVINDEDCGYAKLNDILTIEDWDEDEDDPYYTFEESHDELSESHLELVNPKKTKENRMKTLKKEKFMVYGTGCNNKSDLVDSLPKVKEVATDKVHDSSWTGDIIIYKLVPVSVASKSVKLTKIK
jgi:hypothetical protein